jgi:hypothetical protein
MLVPSLQLPTYNWRSDTGQPLTTQSVRYHSLYGTSIRLQACYGLLPDQPGQATHGVGSSVFICGQCLQYILQHLLVCLSFPVTGYIFRHLWILRNLPSCHWILPTCPVNRKAPAYEYPAHPFSKQIYPLLVLYFTSCRIVDTANLSCQQVYALAPAR